MNYNYKNSVAELDARFVSGVTTVTNSPGAVFDTVGIYVPSYLATGNVVGFEEADKAGLKDKPLVVLCDSFNYTDYMEGDLLRTWGPVFSDGANISVKVLLVVFYAEVADIADWLTVEASSIESLYLTRDFELTYFLSYWKVMFSAKHNGNDTDDSLYFDLSLCLAQLCRDNSELSYMLSFVHSVLPDDAKTVNKCWMLLADLSEEESEASALNISIPDVEPRARYYWGMLYRVLQAFNCWTLTTTENENTFAYILKLFYSTPNSSGIYMGNGLSGLRLTDSVIKPTGLPSILDSSVNQNLSKEYYERLDAKHVSYLRSIADGTGNNAIVVSELGVLGDPVLAIAMGKYIDYTTSQAVALYKTSIDTVTSPIRRTAEVYNYVIGLLRGNINLFARLGILSNVTLNFPAFADLPESKTDILINVPWTATFVYKLEKVTVTGNISA